MFTAILPHRGNIQHRVMPDADVTTHHIDRLTDTEILEQITNLRGKAYQNLSRTHREWLEDLLREANNRKLQIPEET